MTYIPELRDDGLGKVLYVDGKPFLAVGGEIHNSSSSDLRYMEEIVWPSFMPLSGNFMLAPVYWEKIEPEEGVFDFSLADGLIRQAEEHNVKLGLLWFGLYKGPGSDYMPLWLKKSTGRYTLQRDRNGQPTKLVSPFSEEAVLLDRNAYIQFMSHLRDFDTNHTVICIQVENEPGVWFEDRDYCEAANKAYEGEVPEEIKNFFGVSGCWEEAFPEDSCGRFMAWIYSKQLQKIAGAGKEVYPLPTTANCVPGGGAFEVAGTSTFKNFDIWHRFCPAIDLLTPNAYDPDYADVAEKFAPGNEPLFIPETGGNLDAASKFIYSLGARNLVAFSPFGIEDYFGQIPDLDFANNGFGKTGTPYGGEILKRAYEIGQILWEKIRKARADGRVHTFLEIPEKMDPMAASMGFPGASLNIGTYQVDVIFGAKGAKKPSPLSGGLLIDEGNDAFTFFGINAELKFSDLHGGRDTVFVQDKREYVLKDGRLTEGRSLNGDERNRTGIGCTPNVISFRLVKAR